MSDSDDNEELWGKAAGNSGAGRDQSDDDNRLSDDGGGSGAEGKISTLLQKNFFRIYRFY